MSVRVLVVDDQEIVRTALRLVIDRREGLSVIGEAADGERAFALAVELRPDVVLMDIRMPGTTGIEATRRISAEWPGPGPAPRVLLLTTFDLDEYVHEGLRAGADGFLLKNSAPEQLARAIRATAAGESVLAPSVTRRLIDTLTALPPALLPALDAPVAEGVELLTERELQVLVLVGRGLSNARIGEALGLTEANVKSRVNRILTRLGLENRVQAALFAHRAGLN
ncbi:response regulator [Kitasatospora sp. NPDC092948]|uniref:response regulator n=1 Tax=Kitasatospora sp. NPDC092948 TaxID=3364088 RepID=UPI0038273906